MDLCNILIAHGTTKGGGVAGPLSSKRLLKGTFFFDHLPNRLQTQNSEQLKVHLKKNPTSVLTDIQVPPMCCTTYGTQILELTELKCLLLTLSQFINHVGLCNALQGMVCASAPVSGGDKDPED